MNKGKKIIYAATITFLGASIYGCWFLGTISQDSIFTTTVLTVCAGVMLLVIPVYSIRVAKKFFLQVENLSSSLTLILGRMLPCLMAGFGLGMQLSAVAVIYYLDVNYWFVFTAGYAVLQLSLTMLVLILPHLSQLYKLDGNIVVSTFYSQRIVTGKDFISIKRSVIWLYRLHYQQNGKAYKAYFLPSVQKVGKLPKDISLKDLENGNGVRYRFSKLTAWFMSPLFSLL